MAREITWRLSNFGAGLHTRPYQVEAGDIYASDMSNVRVNADGHLVIRYPVRWTGKTLGDTIQGFSVSQQAENFLIPYLLNNGVLKAYIIGGTDPSLVTDTDLSGKIQSVFLIKDVAVVISEGSDQGYWLDLTDYDPPSTPTITTHHFGIDRPDVKNTVLTPGGSGNLEDVAWYYYRLTFYRSTGPLATMESQVSVPMPVLTDAGASDRSVGFSAIPGTTEALSGATEMRLWRSEEDTASVNQTGTATGGDANSMEDTGRTFTKSDIGRWLFNTTDKSFCVITDVAPNEDKAICEDGFSGGTDNTFASGDAYLIADSRPLYLVDMMDIATTTYTDTLSDADLTGGANPVLFDTAHERSTRMPTTTKCLAKYNDRLWAASGNELRYSDVRGAESIWWAFPEVNALWYDAEIHSVAAYRQMLLFGGPRGLWRLIGTDETNFDIEQISAFGPVKPLSWCFAENYVTGQNLFTFVGVSGIYVSNGVDVQRIDEPLAEFFQPHRSRIVDASCVHFPNDETLYSMKANRSDGDKVFNFLRRPDGSWQKSEDLDINQAHVIEITDSVTGHKSFDVYVAEEDENEIREIIWDDDTFTQDLTENDGAIDIDWFWESNRIDWKAQGLADVLKPSGVSKSRWTLARPSASVPRLTGPSPSDTRKPFPPRPHNGLRRSPSTDAGKTSRLSYPALLRQVLLRQYGLWPVLPNE